MKKKVLLTSAIALVTASAMTFAPVSYKVIDKVSAASAQEQTNVEKAQDNLKEIFAQMKKEPALVTAYEAMIKQATADIEGFELNIEGTELDKILTGDGSKVVDYEKIEELLQAVANQLVQDYSTVKGSKFNDVSKKLDAAINDLNAELINYTTVQIDRNDIADLLKEVKDAVFAKIESGEYLDFDFLDNGSLSSAAKQEIKNILSAEWESADNSFVATLKELYAGNKDAVLSDVEILYTAYEDSIEADAKEIYAKGAAALAIGYAKQYFVENPIVTLDVYDKAAKKAYFNVDWSSNLSAVLSVVNFEAGNKTVELEDNDDSTTNRIVVSNVSSSGKTTVEAKLDGTIKGIPAEFSKVTLFSFSYGTSSGGGFGDVVSGDLSLVSNYEAKAQAIAGAVDAFLAQNPELSNNTLTFELKRIIENYVREALLVQAAGAVTIQDGVSSLNVTPAQMENIYNTQLNTVLNAVKAALEAKGIELDLNNVLTYNIGVTNNGQVDVSKALIDSLTSKGVDTVGVKSGDAVIEIALDQLAASSKVSIKKSASSVAGAKSDAYSISVTDAAGASLTAFETQYRVTLPVNGTGSNVTVAQVNNGSLTLIGGQYDAASKTITFFTNQPGEFVVVENTASLNDIANISWAKDKIQSLADKGILLGKGNGKFDPNGKVTRAEFTAMLVRTFNLNATTDLTFNDVNENAWYYDAVAAAKAYGIINGRSASTFDPNAEISREEMASIASNALKAVIGYQAPANADAIVGNFADGSSIAAVHRANVALLKNEGIVQGKGKDNYDPKGDATRAEAAVIVADLLGRR